MISVVSTKKMTPEQRQLLDPEIFTLTEYDAIKIEGVDFINGKDFDHLIFTSQNAVKYYFNKEKGNPSKSCYCVGRKTKLALEQKGQKVVKMTNYSAELADYLVKTDKKGPFLHLCGNLSRPEISSELGAASIPVTPLEVYKTVLNPRHIDKPINAVLFFSPSGVESFTQKNFIGTSTVFCIGTSTAEAARKFTDSIEVAENQTVESVLQTLVNFFKSHK